MNQAVPNVVIRSGKATYHCVFSRSERRQSETLMSDDDVKCGEWPNIREQDLRLEIVFPKLLVAHVKPCQVCLV